MTIKERVQTRMKPKVKQFGFTKKVFRSVAAKIADNLGDVDENALEDDINAKIDEAIEASLPYLALIQSQANEQLEEWKKGQKKNDNNDDEEDDYDDESSVSNSHNRSAKSTKSKEESGQSKAMKELLDAVSVLTNEVKNLKGEKIADTRRAKLESKLKDSGVFGKSKLKDFSRMTFKDDEDFEEYLSGIEDELEAYKQEYADNRLLTAGSPPGGKGGKQSKQKEVVSEDEIKALAQM